MRKTAWAAIVLAGCVVATPDAREVVGDAMTAVGDAMADAGRAIGDSGASAQTSDSVEVACDRTHTTAGGTYAYAEARIDTGGVTGVDVVLCGRTAGGDAFFLRSTAPLVRRLSETEQRAPIAAAAMATAAGRAVTSASGSRCVTEPAFW